MRKNELAYPPASPRDTLRGVFEKMKRAARTKQFVRMAERLAPQDGRTACQRSLYPSTEYPNDAYPRNQYLRPESKLPVSQRPAFFARTGPLARVQSYASK
jgi:hypothetical protein